MKGIVLLVSMLALIFSTQAQDFRPGSLLTDEGDELHGLIRSDFRPGDEELRFRESESGEIRTLSASTLQRIELTVEHEIRIVFSKERIYESYSKAGEPRWLQELISGPVSLYALTDGAYLLYCNGNFMNLKEQVSFYLKRPDDKAARICGTYEQSAFNINADHNFIKLTAEFLSDAPGISERLREREFGILEIPLVVDIYNEQVSLDETLP